MRSIMIRALLFASCSFFLVGCTMISAPIGGGLYTKVTYDGAIGDQAVSPTKTGRACAKSILGLVATGDASVTAAKANGNITKVAHVDHTAMNIYFFYGKYCTIVKGE